jgi:hypothetical protein
MILKKLINLLSDNKKSDTQEVFIKIDDNLYNLFNNLSAHGPDCKTISFEFYNISLSELNTINYLISRMKGWAEHPCEFRINSIIILRSCQDSKIQWIPKLNILENNNERMILNGDEE